MAATGSKDDIVAQLLMGLVFLFVTVLMSTTCAEAAVHAAKRSREIVVSGELSLEMAQRARQSGGVIRVTGSPGGSGAAAVELARSRVIIDGPCNSACAWSFISNQQACFTQRASFGFHAAHDPGTHRRMDAATDYWLAQTRVSLRGQLGGLKTSSRLIIFTAGHMAQHYGDRACGRVAVR